MNEGFHTDISILHDMQYRNILCYTFLNEVMENYLYIYIYYIYFVCDISHVTILTRLAVRNNLQHCALLPFISLVS